MKVFSLEKYKKDMGYTDKEVSEWAKKVAGMPVYEIEEKYCYAINEDWIEEEIMKKRDLKNGDIVTLRNGDRLVLCDECFNDLSGDYSNRLCDLDELRDDLTYKAWDDDSSSDIVKVERPVKYETVFERGEEVKELTVDEISEKLGYKVKVVGLK